LITLIRKEHSFRRIGWTEEERKCFDLAGGTYTTANKEEEARVLLISEDGINGDEETTSSKKTIDNIVDAARGQQTTT
jgi:hypothetical protein